MLKSPSPPRGAAVQKFFLFFPPFRSLSLTGRSRSIHPYAAMKCLTFLLVLTAIIITLINPYQTQELNSNASRKPSRHHKNRSSHKKRPINSSPSAGPLPLWFNGYPKPVWIESPATQIVIKGSSVTLQCSCLSETSVSVTWKKDGEVFDPTESKNLLSTRQDPFNNTVDGSLSNSQLLPTSIPSDMIKFTSSLNLIDLEDGDQGVYQCIGTNNHGSVSSQKAQITIFTKPTFLRTPSDITARVGSNARLECSADAAPSPEISWTKNGGSFPAASERRIHVLQNGKTFVITDVKVSDMGTYSCHARNDAGSISANASVTVLENPHFERPMTNTKAIEGETAVLECAASASPSPTYRWTKDHAPVPMTRRHFIIANQQLLVIVDASSNDSGVYGCHVSNELGAVEQFMQLTVSPNSQRVYFIWCSITVLLLLISMCLIVIKCISMGVFTTSSTQFKSPASPTPPSSPVLTTSLTEQTDLSMTPDIAHYTTIDSPDDFDDSYVVSVNDSYSKLDKKCNISF